MTDKLRFLLIYREDGIPIFTKCYSNFCSHLFDDSARLTTFLSFLEIMGRKISGGQPVSSIQMGDITVKFTKSLPSCHSIVFGIESQNEELFNALFQSVSILLEIKYPDKDWSIVERAFNEEFGKSIVKNALLPAFHGFDVTHGECDLKEECPLHIINTSEREDKTIWARLRETAQFSS